ncbi:putative mitochondrial inner membrane protein COX18-like [Apostichopus japonicus]|uniref:Putative mitochondrial inner membrane protein COX18-like n=1 Tax=Stichopus japonicus TaxID=307972 RepID=A0A2G8K8Z3_STIJA|nr:putative mitochondrial inner membrane protein COX18-like [Apostichopus japonicus]
MHNNSSVHLRWTTSVLQQRVFARIENVQPKINTYVEQTKQQLALIAKSENWSKAEHQTEFNNEVKDIVRAIHTRDKCRPIRLSYVFFAQAGIWVSITTALGQMTGWYPELFSAEPDIDILESLSAGGMLWFSDLMQSDFILPVMVGLVNLALVELWSARRGPLERMQNRFHNVGRVLAIGTMPLAAMMPSAISFYWLVSSLFNLGQFALLRNLWIRRSLGIQQSPSEMKHPLKEIKTALRIKYGGKKVF